MDTELRYKIRNQMIVNLDIMRQLAVLMRERGTPDAVNGPLTEIQRTVELFQEIGIDLPVLS